MTQTPSLRHLAGIQLGVGGLFALIAGWGWGFQLGASTFLGAGIMMFNLIFLGWTWQRLFRKKSIAWTSLIIVIKYAVLLSSIYYLAQMDWFSPFGAGLGITSFMVAALVFAANYYWHDLRKK